MSDPNRHPFPPFDARFNGEWQRIVVINNSNQFHQD